MKAAAARAAKARERKRSGVLLVTVPVTWADIDTLIDAKVLGEWDEANRKEIALAISELLRVMRDGGAKADLLSIGRIISDPE